MNPPKSREEELFFTALALPLAGRSAYLSSACGDDDTLRGRVELLLRAHEEARSFMETSPAAGAAETPTRHTLQPEEKPGETIGRYKLLQKIGEGGCGVVYMAEQQEPVVRRVALKVIKLGMDTKEVIARFEAERQALALMNHPNIASVLDGGATDAGRPFFVMELVRGVPITKFCDEQNLTTAARLELFTAVCHAVQHAHQKGIIHRDLKPSNILVTLHDGKPVPKVIDFGIAKATQGKLTDSTVFTAFEQFIGTPAYMSPEQAEMSGLDIDTRSDIYSLGVLLYELLTGRPPFDPKTLVAGGLDEIRRIIREVEPPKPSTRLRTLSDLDRATIAKSRSILPGQLSTLLRGDLDWIVMRCLEKDRTRRYETTNGVAADIHRHLHDEPVTARPPSAAYRARKLVARNRLVFGSMAAVAISLIVGLVIAVYEYRQESVARERAVLAEHQQAAERQKAEAARRAAERAELTASVSAAKLSQNLYAADIYLAQNLLRDEGTHSLAERILRTHVPAPGENDHRGFEWRYLWNQSQGDKLLAWSGQQGVVRNIVRSPDGRLLATSGRGALGERGHVCVWEAKTRQLLADFKETECVGFSHDGTRLVTATRESQIQVWRIGSWEMLREFSAANIAPFANQHIEMAMSPAAPILAMCPDGSYNEAQGSTRLWNFETGEFLGRLEDSGDQPAFTPDGRTLVTLRAPGSAIKIWDVATRTLRRTIERATNNTGIVVSPDGRLVISTGGGAIRSWVLATGADGPRIEAALPRKTITPIAMSPDGRMIATGDIDKKVRLWEFPSGRKLAELTGSGGWVWAVEFSADGSQIYSGGRDEMISVWSAQAAPDRSPSALGPEGFAFSQDGSMIAAKNPLGEITIRSVKDNSETTTLPAGSTPLWLSAGGQRLLALRDSAIQVWDVPRRTVVTSASLTPAPTSNGVRAISRDGRALAIANSAGRMVTVWDTASGSARGTFAARSDISALAFSPDGNQLAVGGVGNYVAIWSVSPNRLDWDFAAHRSNVAGIRFSADGVRLVTWAINGELKVWDLVARAAAMELQRTERWVEAADFTPDGRTLITLNSETMKFWHLATQREIASFPSAVNSRYFAFDLAPDGRCLAIARGVANRHVELTLTPVPSLAEIDLRFAQERRLASHTQVFTTVVRPPDRSAAMSPAEDEKDGAIARARRAVNATTAGLDSREAVQARQNLAMELARAGRNDEALREFLWCLDIGTKGRAEFASQRFTRLFPTLAQLGAPGIAALRERLEAAVSQLERTPSDQFVALDYAWLNHTLKDDAATIAYLEALPTGDARRRVLTPIAYAVLQDAQRYSDAIKLKSLAAMTREFESRMESYRRRKTTSTSQSVEKAIGDTMIRATARDVEVLIGTGQLEAGQTLGERILAIGDPAEVRELLRTVARRAGHPELWQSPDSK